jgi:modulator of FtsH protease
MGILRNLRKQNQSYGLPDYFIGDIQNMNRLDTAVVRSNEQILATNKVIKNTYMLLSATLLFSALMAAISTALHLPQMTYLLSVGGAFLMIWLVLPKTANSTTGLWVVFGITGLLGFALGPILNIYLALASGPKIVATALGGTGTIFLALSGYALTTRKDFSFMGGFLFAGLILAFVAIGANIFLELPALALAISAVIIMLMSGFILYDTSRMIHDGQANYLLMTVGLYLSIFNIFVSLLHILGAFAGDD